MPGLGDGTVGEIINESPTQPAIEAVTAGGD
jgi:hypothetical protein